MSKVSIYSYRYMWTLKGSKQVNFKIVSDTEEGLKEFEKLLLGLDGLECCAREYIQEYDCSKVGKFDKLFGGIKNEESSNS